MTMRLKCNQTKDMNQIKACSCLWVPVARKMRALSFPARDSGFRAASSSVPARAEIRIH